MKQALAFSAAKAINDAIERDLLPLTPPLFATNANGYYMEILCPIDREKLDGVILHLDRRNMFEYAAVNAGIPMDEIDGTEVKIKRDDDGVFYELGPHSQMWTRILCPAGIEDYISLAYV